MPFQPVIQSAETLFLGLALCSGSFVHQVFSLTTNTRYTRPVLFANCIISGFAAAITIYLGIHHTALEIGIPLAVPGGFGIDAVWGTLSRWRLTGLAFP